MEYKVRGWDMDFKSSEWSICNHYGIQGDGVGYGLEKLWMQNNKSILSAWDSWKDENDLSMNALI